MRSEVEVSIAKVGPRQKGQKMQMFRTRFARDVVTEFLPPTHARKVQRVIVLCDGMPSLPRKQSLAEFLSAGGYWVFYPRYRGAWESGGEFLARSPHLDILDVVSGLTREFRELAFGRQFRVPADETSCPAISAPRHSSLRP